MRRLPPLGPIEAFITVARSGSVKAGAESLALSPPALTRRIQSLEHFVGGDLFDRSASGLRLNERGEHLRDSLEPHVEGLLQALSTAELRSNAMQVRIGVPSLFAAQRLVPALHALRNLHGDFRVDLDTSSDRLARIGDEVEASIVIARNVGAHLYSRLIERGRVIAIGSRALRDGHRIREPADLARVPILLHKTMPDSFEIWSRAVGAGPLRPAVAGRFDAGQLMLDAAAEGLGVAFMFESHLQGSGDDRLVRLFEASVESPYAYWFAATEAAMTRRPVRLFHDWLFAHFRG